MLPSPSFEDVVKSAGYLNTINQKVRITMKLSTDKIMLSATATQSNSKQILVFLKSQIIAVGSTIY